MQMNILFDIIHWLLNNIDTLHKVHDNLVEELIRYFELYVVYRQFRKTRQEHSSLNQEQVDSSENDVNNSDKA